MKNRGLQKIVYGILGLALGISLGFASYATRSEEIDRTQSEIDKTQDEIDRQQDEIDKTQNEIEQTRNKQQKLEEAKAGMEAYLKDLNNQYASIGEQIEDLNQQIEEKEQEIAQTQADLEEAKRVEEQQYEDMKTRIQYMYENSQDNFWTILLEEGSFTAALNKANYAVSIAAYDRQMMENYVAQKEAIEDKEAELQGQKEALDELKIPNRYSFSAGAYLCNHVLYGALHLGATRFPEMKSLFLHVPYLPEQAEKLAKAQEEDAGGERSGPVSPSMPLETIVKGVEAVLAAAIAQWREEHLL